MVDFTGRNPNVFYETAIAHRLGRLVVPITQDADDVPFDLTRYRYQRYLANGERPQELVARLAARLADVAGR